MPGQLLSRSGSIGQEDILFGKHVFRKIPFHEKLGCNSFPMQWFILDHQAVLWIGGLCVPNYCDCLKQPGLFQDWKNYRSHEIVRDCPLVTSLGATAVPSWCHRYPAQGGHRCHRHSLRQASNASRSGSQQTIATDGRAAWKCGAGLENWKQCDAWSGANLFLMKNNEFAPRLVLYVDLSRDGDNEDWIQLKWCLISKNMKIRFRGFYTIKNDKYMLSYISIVT